MDIVIALDFDGTLYPITDYDSEQLLLHLSGREGAEELIERDQKGGFDPITFNRDYERIITGLEEEYIHRAASMIHDRISETDLLPLKRILKHENCHLAVISCGSDRLIEEFLRLEGLEAEFVAAKKVKTENGRIKCIEKCIGSIEDKAAAVSDIRRIWPGCTVIAAGDGPTDIHMLMAADHAFVVSWNGRKRVEGFEIINGFERIEETALELMGDRK